MISKREAIVSKAEDENESLAEPFSGDWRSEVALREGDRDLLAIAKDTTKKRKDGNADPVRFACFV